MMNDDKLTQLERRAKAGLSNTTDTYALLAEVRKLRGERDRLLSAMTIQARDNCGCLNGIQDLEDLYGVDRAWKLLEGYGLDDDAEADPLEPGSAAWRREREGNWPEDDRDMRGITVCSGLTGWHVYSAGPCFDTYEKAIAYRESLDAEGVKWRPQP